MEYSDLDSYSEHSFPGIMGNHGIKFYEQNEFLRGNRQTNDTSNQLPIHYEEEFSESFPNFDIQKKPSDSLDNYDIFYQSPKNQDNQNEEKKSEILKPIDDTPKKNKKLEAKKEIGGPVTTSLLLFTVFHKNHHGRTSNELKDNPNYHHNPKHPGNALDNSKIKVIRSCIIYISLLIKSICLSLGKEYIINDLNNTHKMSPKECLFELFDKTMLELFINNFAKRNSKSEDMEKKYKNRRIYNDLVVRGKLAQSPLLTRIFEMTFGEVLFKFINDDNFAQQIDHNFSFTTFSDIFTINQYPEVLIEDLQKSLRKLLGEYFI